MASPRVFQAGGDDSDSPNPLYKNQQHNYRGDFREQEDQELQEAIRLSMRSFQTQAPFNQPSGAQAEEPSEPTSPEPPLESPKRRRNLDDCIAEFTATSVPALPRIPRKGSDVVIFIDPPPMQDHQSERIHQQIIRHYSKPFFSSSFGLHKLNSEFFEAKLGPTYQFRIKKRRRFEIAEWIAQNEIDGDFSYYFIDLTPPLEGSEAIDVVMHLSCPLEIRLWKQSTSIWHVSPDLVGGKEEFTTINPPASPRLKHPTGSPRRMSFKELDDEVTDEYSPIRHRAAIERLLLSIHDFDARLDSAPKVFTCAKLAKVYSIMNNPMQDYIVRWLRATPNSNIIEVMPEVVLEIADAVQAVSTTRDAFALLVGEAALDKEIEKTGDGRLVKGQSIHGRRKHLLLDESWDTRLEYSSIDFSERVKWHFNMLSGSEMVWIESTPQLRWLLEKHRSDKSVQDLVRVLKDYVRGLIYYTLCDTYSSLGPKSVGVGVNYGQDSRLFSFPKSRAVWDLLRPYERIFTRTFWDLLHAKVIGSGNNFSGQFEPFCGFSGYGGLCMEGMKLMGAGVFRKVEYDEVIEALVRAEDSLMPVEQPVAPVEHPNAYNTQSEFFKTVMNQFREDQADSNSQRQQSGPSASGMGTQPSSSGNTAATTAPIDIPQGPIGEYPRSVSDYSDASSVSVATSTASTVRTDDLRDPAGDAESDYETVALPQESSTGQSGPWSASVPDRSQQYGNPQDRFLHEGAQANTSSNSRSGQDGQHVRFSDTFWRGRAPAGYTEQNVSGPDKGEGILSCKWGCRGCNIKFHAIRGVLFSLPDFFSEVERGLERSARVMLKHCAGSMETFPNDVPNDYLSLSNVLVCVDEREFKYLPLWAGGLDDGSNGVYQSEIPFADNGFSAPGPHIHGSGPKTIRTSATSEFDMVDGQSSVGTSNLVNDGYSEVAVDRRKVYAASDVDSVSWESVINFKRQHDEATSANKKAKKDAESGIAMSDDGDDWQTLQSAPSVIGPAPTKDPEELSEVAMNDVKKEEATDDYGDIFASSDDELALDNDGDDDEEDAEMIEDDSDSFEEIEAPSSEKAKGKEKVPIDNEPQPSAFDSSKPPQAPALSQAQRRELEEEARKEERRKQIRARMDEMGPMGPQTVLRYIEGDDEADMMRP